MLRRLTRALGLAMTVAITLLLGAGAARAEPTALNDVARFGDTVDGWRLNLTMTEMNINAVPNMAATVLTREGFVTGKVTATITGEGALPVNSGELVVGVQLGCQINLEDGLDLGVGSQSDLIADDAYLNFRPDIGTTLKPGSIKTLGLGSKSLKGRTGVIFVRDAHVQVDGCGGPVSVRLFAAVVMSTDTSDDSVNAYGDLLRL